MRHRQGVLAQSLLFYEVKSNLVDMYSDNRAMIRYRR